MDPAGRSGNEMLMSCATATLATLAPTVRSKLKSHPKNTLSLSHLGYQISYRADTIAAPLHQRHARMVLALALQGRRVHPCRQRTTGAAQRRTP